MSNDSKPVMGGIVFGPAVPGGRVVSGPVTGPVVVPEESEVMRSYRIAFARTQALEAEIASLTAALETANADRERLRADLAASRAQVDEMLRVNDEAHAEVERLTKERDAALDKWARAHGGHSALHPLMDGADGVLDRVRAALGVPPGGNVIGFARDVRAERDAAVACHRDTMEHHDRIVAEHLDRAAAAERDAATLRGALGDLADHVTIAIEDEPEDPSPLIASLDRARRALASEGPAAKSKEDDHG